MAHEKAMKFIILKISKERLNFDLRLDYKYNWMKANRFNPISIFLCSYILYEHICKLPKNVYSMEE